MLGLMEDEVTRHDGKHSPECAHAEREGGGIRLEQEDIAHELEVVVHGICVHHELQDARHLRDEIRGPEDGREIGPRSNHDTPQMTDIAEKDGERAQQQAETHAERHKQDEDHRQPDEVPRGHNAEPQHDNSDSDERKGKINEREQSLLHREHKAVHLNLLKKRRSIDDRGQGRACRFRHKREGNVAHDKVERVHLRSDGTISPLSENRAKDDCHDDHHEQRVEHAPRNAQHRATVSYLKILGHELLEDEEVFLHLRAGMCRTLRLDGYGHDKAPYG